METQGPPASTGIVIPNLKVVKCGMAVYIGKAETAGAGMTFQLLDAMEIIPMRKPTPQGISVQIVPVPVAPFNGPTVIEVHPDMVADASGDEQLGAMYRGLTGNTGIVLPQLTR